MYNIIRSVRCFIIKHSGWVFIKPWWYYFIELPKENFLYLFSLTGFYFIIKKIKLNKESLVLIITLFLGGFFVFLAHKEMRFLVLLIPYLALIAGLGIKKLLKYNKRHWISILFILLLLFYRLENSLNPNSLESPFYMLCSSYIDVQKCNKSHLFLYSYATKFIQLCNIKLF